MKTKSFAPFLTVNISSKITNGDLSKQKVGSSKKDGTSFCPEHIPEWVENWRKNNGKRGT